MSNLSAATDHDDRDVFNIKEEAVLKTEGKGEEMFPPRKAVLEEKRSNVSPHNFSFAGTQM